MGIDRRMSTYKTFNSGTTDRITNLRLGVELLDDTLVPPAARSRSTRRSESGRSSAASGRRR